jgi:hypothetical protein
VSGGHRGRVFALTKMTHASLKWAEDIVTSHKRATVELHTGVVTL